MPNGTEGGAGDQERLRDILLFLPRFATLLGRLIADSEVQTSDKVMLGAALAYLASPIDLIPDFVPVLGQLDDFYLVTLCLLRLVNRSGDSKLRQYWDGPEDIVKLLGTATEVSTRYLPEALRSRIREWVEDRSIDGPPPPGEAS